MLKFAILAALFVPSTLAALSDEEMASALIAAENTGTLEETFKKYEKEQSRFSLSWALADVSKIQSHMPKVVECLRMAHDPSPSDKLHVSELVNSTLLSISNRTNTESFTNVIACFKTSDIKLLVSIRFWILWRQDVVDVLKSVMTRFPKLITEDLPSWIAFHSLDRNSKEYSSSREEAFKYLTSFATEDVLAKALTILKSNEHYKAGSLVMCCKSQSPFPQDLTNRVEALLALVKARNALMRETLTFLPEVLIDLMSEYTTFDGLDVLSELVKVRNALIREALTFLPKVIVDMVSEHTTCDTI